MPAQCQGTLPTPWRSCHHQGLAMKLSIMLYYWFHKNVTTYNLTTDFQKVYFACSARPVYGSSVESVCDGHNNSWISQKFSFYHAVLWMLLHIPWPLTSTYPVLAVLTIHCLIALLKVSLVVTTAHGSAIKFSFRHAVSWALLRVIWPLTSRQPVQSVLITQCMGALRKESLMSKQLMDQP